MSNGCPKATLPVRDRGPRAGSRPHALKSWIGAAKAHVRAALHGGRLAPGSLRPPDARALADPRLLLKLQQRHGPIFKAWLGGKVTTCICTIPLGRRFLAENEHCIEGATIDFRPLFPHGTLRQMSGEPHRDYRRMFVEAFKATDLGAHETAVRGIIDEALASLADRTQPIGHNAVRATLKRGLTEIFFRLILGVDREWHGFERLLAAYERYAPDGTFITVRPEHRDVYREMRELLLARAGELRAGSAFPSLLGYLSAAGKLDETAVGNLLQMTEAARFDIMGLWSWLIRMVGAEAGLLDQVAAETDSMRRTALCEAVTLEALRLEQSEFVLRRATSGIRFGGYFIPRRSLIRIAVWEAHKDAANFDDPFHFDPSRFLGVRPPADVYSPFGLDKHRCVGADWVVGLSAIFVEQAAACLRWEIVADAVPERGVFHFEPNEQMAVCFTRT